MIRLFTLLTESNFILNVDSLSDKLESFKEKTNYTDWFMQGGCYNFAAALNKILRNSKIILIGDDTADNVHVCILWKGMYIDYNSVTANINNIVSDITLNGKPRFKAGNISDLTNEYNYDSSEVNQIVTSLTSKKL
jgi:hypothetical protein